MQRSWMWAAAVAVTGCAFPGSPGYAPQGRWEDDSSPAYPQSSSAGGTTTTDASPGDDGPLVMTAYAATGVRDGREVTISRSSVEFGLVNGDVVVDGDCWAARVPPGQPLYAVHDAGSMTVRGGRQPYSCGLVDGVYRCDLPENEGFFEPGVALGLSLAGNATTPRMTIGGVIPPRAPVPEGDLAGLFDASGPVEIRWAPSGGAAQMTCLNLESLDDDGNVTAFAQCDVDDATGSTTVPPVIMAVVRQGAPTMRATLYSANMAGTKGAYAVFGSGRFVEVRR